MHERRHAVVTGGSQGLGRSLGAVLAARGDRVTLVARDEGRLRDAARAMRGDVAWRSADVTDRASLHAAIASAVASSGPCDLLVAAAGAARPGYVTELREDVFRAQMELNYFGVLNAVHAVVPGMISRRRGAVCAVASTAALMGVYGYAAYAPSKFAVRGLMEVLRSELKPYGVHVACVFPPDMRTEGLDAENRTKPEETRRIAGSISPRDPDDVARRVVRGLDRGRSVITVDPLTAGIARLGGLAAPLLDRLTDRAVARTARSGPPRGAAPQASDPD